MTQENSSSGCPKDGKHVNLPKVVFIFGLLFGAGTQYRCHCFYMLIDPIEHFRRNNVTLRQLPPVLVDEFDGLDHYLQDGRLRKP